MRASVLLGLSVLAALSLALGSYAPPALADDANQTASELFREGEEAFNAHDYRRAAALFEQANRVRPHPAALWNAARASQRAGEKARAANLFARVVHDEPDGPDADDSRTALATLGKELGRVRVVLGKGVTLPRLDAESIRDAEVVYVEPGPHVLEASVPGGAGGAIRKPVDTHPGELVEVELAGPDAATPPAASAGWPPGIAYALGATTAVLAGVTTWSAIDTLHFHNSVYDPHPTNPNFDTGLAKQLRTNILLGSTVLFAGLTLLAVVYTDFDRPLLGTLRPDGIVF